MNLKDPQEPAGARAAHILLADDDFEMRKLLGWSLGRAGYRVTECADGDALLRKLDDHAPGHEQFDLLITDVRMPGTGGMQALRHGWQRGDWPPVILITAFPDPELRERARRLGARAILAKPFDVDELLALVSRLLPAQAFAGGADLRPAGEPALPFPLEITYRHGELAAPLRDYIHEAACRFLPHAEAIRDCCVVIEEARPEQHRKRRIRVSLRLRTTAGNVTVKLDSDRAGAHANPYLTLHAAFTTALHKLQRRRRRRSTGHAGAGAARGDETTLWRDLEESLPLGKEYPS